MTSLLATSPQRRSDGGRARRRRATATRGAAQTRPLHAPQEPAHPPEPPCVTWRARTVGQRWHTFELDKVKHASDAAGRRQLTHQRALKTTAADPTMAAPLPFRLSAILEGHKADVRATNPCGRRRPPPLLTASPCRGCPCSSAGQSHLRGRPGPPCHGVARWHRAPLGGHARGRGPPRLARARRVRRPQPLRQRRGVPAAHGPVPRRYWRTGGRRLPPHGRRRR